MMLDVAHITTWVLELYLFVLHQPADVIVVWFDLAARRAEGAAECLCVGVYPLRGVDDRLEVRKTLLEVGNRRRESREGRLWKGRYAHSPLRQTRHRRAK